MAEDKKSFVLYADLIHTIEHLTNEEKGLLFQHLLEYVNDKNPVLEDRILLIAWKPIERQLKRDLKSYEKKKKTYSDAGKLGNLKKYYPDLYDLVVSEKITLKVALESAEYRKASQGDNGASQGVAKLAVNDTVNVTVNDTTNKAVEVDFFKVDEWITEIGKSKTYLEGLYGTHKLYKGSISEILRLFKEHLKIFPKKHNNFSDFKTHFAYWLNIKSNKKELAKYQKQSKGQL